MRAALDGRLVARVVQELGQPITGQNFFHSFSPAIASARSRVFV